MQKLETKSHHAHPDMSIHRGLDAPDVQSILDQVHMDYRDQLKQPDHEVHEVKMGHSDAQVRASLPSSHFVPKYGDKLEDAHYDGRR